MRSWCKECKVWKEYTVSRLSTTTRRQFEIGKTEAGRTEIITYFGDVRWVYGKCYAYSPVIISVSDMQRGASTHPTRYPRPEMYPV